MDVNQPNAPQQSEQSPGDAQSRDIHENKDMAALSYVWILSVVVFFTKRQSPFVYFHVKQGLVLFALSLVAGMFGFVGKILLLIILALSVIGFLNAAQGLSKDLPIVGALARADLPALSKSTGGIFGWIGKLWKRKPKPAQTTPAPAAASSETLPVLPEPRTPPPAPEPITSESHDIPSSSPPASL